MVVTASAATPSALRAATVAAKLAGGTGTHSILNDTTLAGRSGKLRARIVTPNRRLAIPVLEHFFGDSVMDKPGVYSVNDSTGAGLFSFITLLPFTQKDGGSVGDYRVGFWPEEKGRLRNDAYENPEGFIVVTPQNENTRVSEHFMLRDFLTHDQQDTWPKYLVLREELVDKLELVIEDLRLHGVNVNNVEVMSGFRTPEYNQKGVGRRGGRAKDSRHQYGDAADIFIDANHDGRMDDLNHDGHVNSKDARVIIAAVDRVEAAHPELVGGAGSYRGTRQHGPFTHIDVRGTRARWSRG